MARHASSQLALRGFVSADRVQRLGVLLGLRQLVVGLVGGADVRRRPTTVDGRTQAICEPERSYSAMQWHAAHALLSDLRHVGAASDGPLRIVEPTAPASLDARHQKLRDYYPVLGLVAALLREADEAEALWSFVRQVSIPSDLRSLLHAVVQADGDGRRARERTAPLAAVSPWLSLRVHQRLRPHPIAVLTERSGHGRGAGRVPGAFTTPPDPPPLSLSQWSDPLVIAHFFESPEPQWMASPNLAQSSASSAPCHTLPWADKILLFARAGELARGRAAPAPWVSSTRHWLRHDLQASDVTGASIEALLRLASAVDLDPSAVPVAGPAPCDRRSLLDMWVAMDRQRAYQHAATFFAASARMGAKRRLAGEAAPVASDETAWKDVLVALQALLHPIEGPEIGHVLQACGAASSSPRLDWATLSPVQRAQLVSSLMQAGDTHCVAGLTYLLVDASWASHAQSFSHCMPAERDAAVTPHGVTTVLRDVGALSAEDREYAFDGLAQVPAHPHDFSLRVALLTLRPEATVDDWVAACTPCESIADAARAPLLIDLWHRRRGQGASASLFFLLARLVGAGWLAQPLARAALMRAAVDDRFVITRAKQTLLEATASQLSAWHATWGGCLQLSRSPQGHVFDLLAARHRQDMSTRVPLDLADRQRLARPRHAVRTQTVCGVPLEVIGEAAQALPAGPSLHMGQSTQDNLRLLCMAWLQKEPIWLEGMAAAGKTTLVQFVAAALGLRCRRINVSPHSETADLIGRWTLAPIDARGKMGPPRWVDGPLLHAMRYGEVLLIDEANLAPTEILERLNQLFDDEGVLTVQEHKNEVVPPHRNFRCIAAVNPSNTDARQPLTAAMRSRWQKVTCVAPSVAELEGILQIRAPQLSAARRRTLARVHRDFVRRAEDGLFGHGAAFSIRSMLRAAYRVQQFDDGEPGCEAVVSRELWETYAGGFSGEDEQDAAAHILGLDRATSGTFYHHLTVRQTNDGLCFGDVQVVDMRSGDPRVPSTQAALVLTPRTTSILYRIAKALACQEHVALIGPRASGKTAMVRYLAHLLGQPYFRQALGPDTEASELIGSWQADGWHEGPLLVAGRPTGPAGVFLLDEANLASSAVLERLNSILDGDRSLTLAEKDGECVTMHPRFRFIAAMNPATPDYAGRRTFSAALQTRLTLISVPEPDAAEIRSIAAEMGRRHGVAPSVVQQVVRVHCAVSAEYEQARSGADGPSLRELTAMIRKVAQLTVFETPAQACGHAARLTYAHYIADQQIDALNLQAQRP